MRVAGVAAAARKVQSLERKDREDAGHQVEQDSARDRTQDCPKGRVRADLADRAAAARNGPGGGVKFQSAPVAER